MRNEIRNELIEEIDARLDKKVEEMGYGVLGHYIPEEWEDQYEFLESYLESPNSYDIEEAKETLEALSYLFEEAISKIDDRYL